MLKRFVEAMRETVPPMWVFLVMWAIGFFLLSVLVWLGLSYIVIPSGSLSSPSMPTAFPLNLIPTLLSILLR